MKILVPIKRVPDPAKRVRLTPDGQLDLRDTYWVINPYDEAALEAALRLRDTRVVTRIIAVTRGTAHCEDQLRAALAMGANSALLVLDDAPSDESNISGALAAVARRENPDIILMGGSSTDEGSSQIPQRVAALLDWPQATDVTHIEIMADKGTVRVTRAISNGHETLELTLPCVLTADLKAYPSRYIPLQAIIEARIKPLEQIAASEFGPQATSCITILQNEKPPPRAACRMLANLDEFADVLCGE